MLFFPELHDVLVSLLSNLNEADVKFLIEELHKERVVQGGVETLINNLAFRFPKLLLTLQEAYPAFSASFTVSSMIAVRAVNLNIELSFLDAASRSVEGCEFLDRLRQFNKDLIVNIPPAAMFRVHFDEDKGVRGGSTPFTKLTALQKGRYLPLLACWLEGDAWINYIITLYSSSPGQKLVNFTNLVIRSFLVWGEENPPFLRLLQKHPGFISSLVPNGIFYKINQLLTVFGMLCTIPQYHPYLSDLTMWGNFKKMDINVFFDNSKLTIPFSLSRTEHGLSLLHSILMLRPDIRKEITTHALFVVVNFPQAPDGRTKTCLYRTLNQSEEGREIIELLKKEAPHLTQQFIDQTLSELGLDFLTDEERAIVNKTRLDVNVDSLTQLMKRPDAQRLLFCSSGLENYFSLFVDMLLEDVEALRAACVQDPGLIKVFPRHFLMSTVNVADKEGIILDIILAKPTARRLLELFAPYDEFFDYLDPAVYFDNVDKMTKQLYYELILRDEKLHFLLFKMMLPVLKDKKNARYFVENYYSLKLSEGMTISMTCKYCPAFALALAKTNGKKSGLILFDASSLVPSHFYWLARYLPAHETLFSIFCATPQLFALISAANVSMALPAPFPPNEKLSPLEALVQTPHGRGIIKLYIYHAMGSNALKALAKPAYFCKVIKSDNPLLNGKDVLGVLLSSQDIEGDAFTGLVVKLVECNPELIDHATPLTLALLRDAPGLKAEIVDLIDKRLRAESDRIISVSEGAAESSPSMTFGK